MDATVDAASLCGKDASFGAAIKRTPVIFMALPSTRLMVSYSTNGGIKCVV